MDESLMYLLIDLGAISIPFIFSFHPKLRFDKTWFAFFPACIFVAVLFIIWDIWFTNMGVWGFTERYLSGFYIFNLPIEECLFFFCIPYACVYTYHCLNVLIKKDLLASYVSKINIFLVVILLIIGLCNLDKWYTGLTFLLTALSILYLGIIKKSPFLSRFYLSYLAILPFFFLTNGILTGSFIEEQIVWYDNFENLNIRMGTIPVEDSIYGLLLLIWNVAIYEKILKSRN